MGIRLRNRWKLVEKDYWEWEAFIDDNGSGELDEIEYVEYILHPTFKDPVRKIRSRRTNFTMETAGWGTFSLKAYLNKKDGTIKKLDLEIVLKNRPPEGVSP